MFYFFFNDTATTEIYTLSLHDALPICHHAGPCRHGDRRRDRLERTVEPVLAQLREVGDVARVLVEDVLGWRARSEEHTSELQSRQYLVCRLLLEKKKYNNASDASYSKA